MSVVQAFYHAVDQSYPVSDSTPSFYEGSGAGNDRFLSMKELNLEVFGCVSEVPSSLQRVNPASESGNVE
jgi:hypothetical protein